MLKFEEYTILDELGSGSSAVVYKVRHNELGYVRAIRKVLFNENIEDNRNRFLEECKRWLKLGSGNHPNIVRIYKPIENNTAVEMDYVDGQDLKMYLSVNSSFVEIDEVLKLLWDIGGALAYCHEDIYQFCMDKEEDNLEDDPNDGTKVLLDEQKRLELIEKYRVIHNDIKSDNIIRRNDGTYILSDFGFAIEGSETLSKDSLRRQVGALEYKAPERWDTKTCPTETSDIYSFGIVLYEYLAGRLPFVLKKDVTHSFDAEGSLYKEHKSTIPESILNLRKTAFEKSHPGKVYKIDYPEWLETLIMKCLAKRPEDRFRNGKELFEYVKKHSHSEDKKGIEALLEKNRTLTEKLDDLERKNTALILDLEKMQSLMPSHSMLQLQDQLAKTMKEREAYQKEVQEIRSRLKSVNIKKIWKPLSILLLLVVITMSVSLVYMYNAEPVIYSGSDVPDSSVTNLKLKIAEKDEVISILKAEKLQLEDEIKILRSGSTIDSPSNLIRKKFDELSRREKRTRK